MQTSKGNIAHKHLPLFLLLPWCLLNCCDAAFAERIRAFVPNKPWEVEIEIADFEPWDVLQPKTILGGSTTNGVLVTITLEKEEPSTTPAQALAKYWHYGAPDQYIMEFTNASIVVVSAKTTQSVLGLAFNGYAVKDDCSFDIHLSADLARMTRQQVIGTIRSFKVKPSPEQQAMEKLARDLTVTKEQSSQERLLLAFTKQYPRNSWAFARLGEVYYGGKQRALAEKAYVHALANHKTQPMINPNNLWLCYDGLGLIYAMSQRYDAAKLYFEKGYQCAEDMDSNEKLASSAYNLACWYSETGDVKSCLKYLAQAVELNPEKKTKAKTDLSFGAMKGKVEFQKLISD